MKNNKAQIQIMQTVVVLLLVFVVLFIGFIFAMTQEKRATQRQLQQLLVLTEQKKSQSINYLTEFNCIIDNVIIKDCFDKLSIESFKVRVKEDNLYYGSVLGTIKIEIEENIDGELSRNIIFENKKEVFETIKQYQLPISLYDPIKNIKNNGVLYLEIYN
jgi:hypothetical protein